MRECCSSTIAPYRDTGPAIVYDANYIFVPIEFAVPNPKALRWKILARTATGGVVSSVVTAKSAKIGRLTCFGCGRLSFWNSNQWFGDIMAVGKFVAIYASA